MYSRKQPSLQNSPSNNTFETLEKSQPKNPCLFFTPLTLLASVKCYKTFRYQILKTILFHGNSIRKIIPYITNITSLSYLTFPVAIKSLRTIDNFHIQPKPIIIRINVSHKKKIDKNDMSVYSQSVLSNA